MLRNGAAQALVGGALRWLWLHQRALLALAANLLGRLASFGTRKHASMRGKSVPGATESSSKAVLQAAVLQIATTCCLLAQTDRYNSQQTSQLRSPLAHCSNSS